MNKKIIILILAAISSLFLIPSQNNGSDFETWKKDFNIKFNEDEEVYRYGIFLSNLAKINEHNSKLGKTYTEGLTQFSALTPQEFAAQYLSSYVPSNNKIEIEEAEQKQINGPTVDWVSWGAVSPVKNQGSCGATYAFSAVGALEGLSAIVYKTQQQLSVQQVIDCSQAYGNNGCVTGRMDNTFAYTRDKGVNLWSAYPYIGNLGKCQAASGLFKIRTFYKITNNCNTLASSLQSTPVSVAVDGQNFQNYISGIFSNCGTNLSLAVLLVGMTDSFWNLKSSWGSNWGENGYIRISRGNTCGICTDACYPSA